MKVKVEIEMPKKCGECPMFYETEGVFADICQLVNSEDWNEAVIQDPYEKPEWCPLNKCEVVKDADQ